MVFAVVSELQEEGMNAINLPLSPTPYELHPEDTMLGTELHRLYTHTHTHLYLISILCTTHACGFLPLIHPCNTPTSYQI